MIVHSCCCIGIFVLSGLISNSKEKFKIYLKFLGKNGKRKKENVLHFLLGFRPVGPAASCFSPRLFLARSAFSRAAVSTTVSPAALGRVAVAQQSRALGIRPASPHGPSPARARARVLLLSVSR
jgi:hypothetical protein